MTTLIAVYNSEGCVGRCDARCYNAKFPNCDCICGGKNHGAGLKKSAENTEKMAEGWIERYNAAHPGQELRYLVPNNEAQAQMRLPL